MHRTQCEMRGANEPKSNLQNLYELARKAKNEGNSQTAQKYYEQILSAEPNSWEASFYAVYFSSCDCPIADVERAAKRLTECEKTVFNLIQSTVADARESKKAVDEIATKLIAISSALYATAKEHYDAIEESARADYTQKMLNNCCSAMDILYDCGDHIVGIFGDEYGADIAVPCWKTAVAQHQALMSYFVQKHANKDVIMSYAAKIKSYDASYQMPKINTSSGCYVATAVYGSYDCPQVWTLRRYRDYTLAQTWHGRAFIRTYYAISPTLVKWFGHTQWFKNMWQGKLDKMVAKLQSQGVESTPYKDKIW